MGTKSGTYEKCFHTGKLCFPTKGQALEVIKKPNVRGKNIKSKRKKREKRCYQCEYCGDWHLTSAEYFSEKQKTTKKPKNVKRDSKRKGGKEEDEVGS